MSQELAFSEACKLLLSDDLDGAQTAFQQLLEENEIDAMAAVKPAIIHNLALILQMSFKYQDAFEMYSHNINAPGIAQQTKLRSMLGMANCCRHLHQTGRSFDLLLMVAELDPRYPQTHFLLSSALIRQNDIEHACRAMLMGMAAVIESKAAETDNFAQCYYESCTSSVYHMKKGCATNLDLLYCERFSSQHILEFHKAKLPKLPSLPRVQVVFVSEHFHVGSVMSNLLPLLENLACPFACLNLGHTVDHVTHKVQQLAKVYMTSHVPSGATFKMAICCDGHTGSKKSLRFLQDNQIAKHNIDYLGYPFSTGQPYISHKIVDSITDPPGQEAEYTETLLYMDPCFLTWKPLNDDPVHIDKYVPDPQKYRVLSPNNFKKLSSTCISYYRALLESNPKIMLHFKSSSHPKEHISYIGQHFFDVHFAEFGNRVAILDTPDSLKEHYELTSSYDLVLDAFPYNGTVTTLESLWCGVPVLTTSGSVHRSRVSESILTCIGASDWIAADSASFCAAADRILQHRGVSQHHDTRRMLAESWIMQHAAYGMKFEQVIGRFLD